MSSYTYRTPSRTTRTYQERRNTLCFTSTTTVGSHRRIAAAASSASSRYFAILITSLLASHCRYRLDIQPPCLLKQFFMPWILHRKQCSQHHQSLIQH